MISTDENGIPTVYECYPDAFKNIYQGKSCSVYVVEDEGFRQGLTSWDEEFVCDFEVTVQKENILSYCWLKPNFSYTCFAIGLHKKLRNAGIPTDTKLIYI